MPTVAVAAVLVTWQQSKQRQRQQHDNNTTTNITTSKTANTEGGNLSNEKETCSNYVFFQCPGMSQPLDSATPARPPKVPFFLAGKVCFMFWDEKKLCLWTLPHIVPQGFGS